MPHLPLLVFDTNILMDVLLGRDGLAAVLLVELAEQGHAELVLPEYVLLEFRGTALRWVRSERERLVTVRRAAKEWMRSHRLDEPADDIRGAARQVESRLGDIASEVDKVIHRVRAIATVEKHTQDLHFRGDLRYLQGLPPDRPVDGVKDCRIYEAILAIARADRGTQRLKYLVTKDSDFDDAILEQELAQLGFRIRKDPGRIYGELRPASS